MRNMRILVRAHQTVLRRIKLRPISQLHVSSHTKSPYCHALLALEGLLKVAMISCRSFGFDPFGLGSVPANLQRFQEAELVHCR